MNWIRLTVAAIILLSACRAHSGADGREFETQVLASYDLRKDYSSLSLLQEIAALVNCADSAILGKRLVFAPDFHSADTGQILLIPYVPNGKSFRSSAYSDINNRFVLINPSYIREFTLNNTLNDTISFKPVLELMLLHEMGHFILRKEGAFDAINSGPRGMTGQQPDNTQPEFLTSLKKVELSADSIAIDLVEKASKSKRDSCLNIAFDVELILPGMQYQLSGRRMIDRFGSPDVGFLHDPSNDHPNLELRVTFMNYFLYPNDTLRQMIDNYLYNRTIAPVHRQESDPRIFQGQEKKLP